ncbi:hypothetical protein [Ralstonia mannitolilytica]|uniref:hypothetical protein n=1 Tax=Ralstonia mannitolilytica TaxID=105219 RepID=UPI0005D9652A|nr:hypothetical protein [Ralstonia mannitolilytica]AJW45412.1 hypothetical protein TK49_12255 [Ralstonia mannitolilytica]QIF07616.1 hypothetical protein G5A69_07955 [Ralstonia mannitolilytica]CAJ0724031.1 hypothetical protein R76706_00202 [Ralstonia mannitolilytica]CAJ0782902.1 hypothetical protein R77555_01004 [Ralstonia mannitolilytica]
MKTSHTLIAALLAVAGIAAFAQTTPVQQVQQDNQQIRQDNRDIRHDNRDIRRDRADIAKDKAALADERAERNAAQRREDRDLANGNVKGAEYWNKQRAQDQHQINAERRDLRHDRKDLRHDVKDRNHDVRARNDEVRERNHAAAKM